MADVDQGVPEVVTTQPGGKQTKSPAAPMRGIPETNCWMALLVTFCFNPPIGIFAIYMSLSSAAAYRDGLKEKGARRAFISIVLSMIGIMITMIIVSAVVGCLTLNRNHTNKCLVWS